MIVIPGSLRCCSGSPRGSPRGSSSRSRHNPSADETLDTLVGEQKSRKKRGDCGEEPLITVTKANSHSRFMHEFLHEEGR